MPDELWTELHDTVQETGIKTIPVEKKYKKSKMAVWGGLTKSCEKRGEKPRWWWVVTSNLDTFSLRFKE